MEFWCRLTRTIHAAVSRVHLLKVCFSVVASETGRYHTIDVGAVAWYCEVDAMRDAKDKPT
jgi:hypothetical protein